MAGLIDRIIARAPALARAGRGLARLTGKPERQGMLGVLLLAATLGLLHVFMLPKFRAADEPRHVAYALLLLDGEWPKVTDPLPLKRLGVKKIMDSGLYVAAANHPPLYYWSVGLPLKIGADSGNLMAGLYVARCLTLLMALVALVYMYLIVKLLWPDRPGIALTSAMLVGILPTYLNTCGVVYNDALGVLTCVGAFHGATALLVAGPTRGRLVATGVWMVLALFTRVSGLFLVAPALLVTCVALLWHTEGPAKKRVVRAVALCAAMVAAILATSGWFYYRNIKLYGDITGSAVLFKLFGRKPHGEADELMLSANRWVSMYDLLWMRLAGHVRLSTKLTSVVQLVSAAGAVLALKALWHRRRALWPRAFVREPRTWGLVACALAFVCVIVPMFIFHARGGNLNMRYLLPVTWVPAMVVAIGFAAFRSPLPAQLGTATLALASLVVHELYAQSIIKKGKAVDLGISAALAEHAGSRRTGVWVCVFFLGVSLGLVLFLRALGAVHRRVDDRGSAPAEPPPDPPAEPVAVTRPGVEPEPEPAAPGA